MQNSLQNRNYGDIQITSNKQNKINQTYETHHQCYKERKIATLDFLSFQRVATCSLTRYGLCIIIFVV